MHESSLVRTLLHQVSDLLIQHHGESVEEIVIELGPLSGVEPLLVRSSFELLAPDYSMQQTRLVIHEIPLEAKCRVCQSSFEIERFKFRCPSCGATDIQVVRGDEFRLINISIKQPVAGNTAV